MKYNKNKNKAIDSKEKKVKWKSESFLHDKILLILKSQRNNYPPLYFTAMSIFLDPDRSYIYSSSYNTHL